MASVFLRGALVEYSGQFLGPIPNIVVFQFNPEQLSRTISIPAPPLESRGSAARPTRTRGQTAAPPTESLRFTAHFSAADDLGQGGAVAVLPRLFGVGPQLAALEKMVYPPKTPGGAIGAVIDAVASALSSGDTAAERTVPREKAPQILFVWGPARVLPVTVTAMSIVEKQFDFILNPVQAEVELELQVASRPPKDDVIATGALEYTNMVKDTAATLNLAKAAELALDLIPF